MLTELHIRDFAIIDELRIDLSSGLTVMTGETGAGKSILVDALGLVAGARADAGMIRHGAERAEISATFDIADSPAAQASLAEHEIEHDGECVARRVIAASGRSSAFLNGSRVPAGTLRTFCAGLLNIHGQQANQSLLQRATQRRVLDVLAGHSALVVAVGDAFSSWQQARRHLDALRQQQIDAGADDLDLLQHQVNELEALAVEPGEVDALEAELRLLGSAGEVLEAVQSTLVLLGAEESGANDMLARAGRLLAGAGASDPRLGEIAQIIDEAQIQASEGTAALERYLGDVELDPQRLDAVERRLSALDEVARKHRVRAGELLAVFDDLSKRLAMRLSAGADLEAAAAALAACEREYRDVARRLHASRAAAAEAMAQDALGIIRSLGLPNARFAVTVEHRADAPPAAHGTDDVAFTVSTNPGQPLAAIERVASGGELSRISLALEVIAAGASTVPCLVFDEVDTGVGGGVAEIVGRRLRELAGRHQVLCVTHLPQVASQAHHHIGVRKQVHAGQTSTRLDVLREDDVVTELARMLGGVQITERTLAHAREMREQAADAD